MDGIMDSIIHHTPIQLEEVLNLQDCFHYQSIASTIPKTGEYVVYMIVSLHSPCNSYIGYTKDLRKRINRHNSIWGGSKGTGGIHTSLAPWVLAAYVYGFNGEKHKAMQLEGSWRTMIERIETNSKHQMNPMNKIHKCESLLEENYQLIICCNITHKQ
jgi:predicted GIY-YIG superfamily endonuclease